MKLKKCPNNHYTLKEICPTCNQKTKSAHYKFIHMSLLTQKIKNVNAQDL